MTNKVRYEMELKNYETSLKNFKKILKEENLEKTFFDEIRRYVETESDLYFVATDFSVAVIIVKYFMRKGF